jgi:predicted RNA-binding protein with PIN domain
MGDAVSDHLIIVDGYNLILRSPELKPGPGRTLREAREKLVNLLSWAVGGDAARFIVVFDGADGASRDLGGSRVAVRFSRPPQKADDLIRVLVEDQVDRIDRVTVVTSDLEVARHARAMGADISLADLFMGSLLAPRPGTEPLEKPATLSRKELEEWAELFRKRQGAGKADDADDGVETKPGTWPVGGSDTGSSGDEEDDDEIVH